MTILFCNSVDFMIKKFIQKGMLCMEILTFVSKNRQYAGHLSCDKWRRLFTSRGNYAAHIGGGRESCASRCGCRYSRLRHHSARLQASRPKGGIFSKEGRIRRYQVLRTLLPDLPSRMRFEGRCLAPRLATPSFTHARGCSSLSGRPKTIRLPLCSGSFSRIRWVCAF